MQPKSTISAKQDRSYAFCSRLFKTNVYIRISRCGAFVIILWVSVITAKCYKMLEESISAYKNDAGRCSEACPALVTLQAACIRHGKVAQRNHWDYFILPRCTTLLSLQKTSLPQCRCKSSINITHAASHEQTEVLMVGKTLHKLWILIYPVLICFQTTSRGGLNTMGIWCASQCPCKWPFSHMASCLVLITWCKTAVFLGMYM